MDDVLKIFGLLLALAGAGSVAYFLVGAAHMTLRRMQRRVGLPPETPDEVDAAEVRGHLAEIETLRARLTEVEERLDFAERLLAQRREGERLPPGRA